MRGSVRNLAKADKVRDTLTKAGADVSRLEFVALDLLKDDGWDAAAEGCRFLLHTASPFVLQMPADKMELIRPAIEGTERALNAGLKAGVERIVLTSSMAAIAYGHDRNRTAPFTAADWTDLEGRGVNAYVESKTRAERRAWEIMKAAGREADLAVINPSGIFGPLLDEDPGTSAQMVDSLPERRRAGRAALQLRVRRRARRRRRPCRGVDRPERRRTSLPDGRADSVALGIRQHPAPALPRLCQQDCRASNCRIGRCGVYALFDADLRGNLGELGVVRRMDSRDVVALLGRDLIPAETAIVATAESLIAFKLV